MRISSVLAVLVLLGCSPASRDPEPGLTPEASWEAFCDQLKEAGLEVLADAGAESELDRAEGLRYLVQQLASATDAVLDAADPSQPLLQLGSHKLRKYGLDAADAKYVVARIEGDGRYRLHGDIGSAHFPALQLFRNHPEFEAFASLSGRDLRPDENGDFEVFISRERPAGDALWLPLDPRATSLLVREYFNDWDSEIPARLAIERLDEVGPPPPLTLGEADAQLREIAARFETRAPMWMGRVKKLRRFMKNKLLAPRDADDQGLGDNAYGAGWFDLEPEEALLIELDAPDAHFWSYQLGTLWWESVDYLSHLGSLNGHQAEASSDGRYRLVISLEDPGVPNWLDPAGHTQGTILYRYQLARTKPAPEMRLVALAGLAELLPADTRRVTPAEREAQLARRRAHAARRWTP